MPGKTDTKSPNSMFQYILKLALAIFIFSAFQACSPKSDTVNEPPNKSDTLAVKTPTSGVRIAFIYGDSINDSYQFLIDAKKELEAEEKNMQGRLRAKLQRAEARAMELQQKAQTMTQTQMQEAQLELQGLDIEMQQFQEKLATDFRQRESELQGDYIGRVDSFLTRYNADGLYDMILNYQKGGQLLFMNTQMDITNEVLKGLNEEYSAEMAAAKAAAPKSK